MKNLKVVDKTGIWLPPSPPPALLVFLLSGEETTPTTQSAQERIKVFGCGGYEAACLQIHKLIRCSPSNWSKATAKQAGKSNFLGFHGVHMLVIYMYSREYK